MLGTDATLLSHKLGHIKTPDDPLEQLGLSRIHITVRTGGSSAAFLNRVRAVRDHIIKRAKHCVLTAAGALETL